MKQFRRAAATAVLATALLITGAFAGTDHVDAARPTSPCLAVDRALAKVNPSSPFYQTLSALSKQCHLAFPASR